MTGPEALQALREGKRVRRKSWIARKCLIAKSKEWFLKWEFCMEFEKGGVYKEYPVVGGGPFLLWDLMEDDWEIVE